MPEPPSDDDHDGDDGGDAFIGLIDDGDDGQCDIFGQDCPPGQKCMPWANDGGSSWNATKCSYVDDDPKQQGEPCTVDGNGVSGVDDCDIGLMCWDVDPETNLGECIPLCFGTIDQGECQDPCHTCAVLNDGVLPLCLPMCDPLLQDCLNDGDKCVPFGDPSAFICVVGGQSGIWGEYLDPCEFVNVCEPGLFCANAIDIPNCSGIVGCCTPFCDLEDPQCPDEDQGVQCLPWYEDPDEAPACGQNVGKCVLPP